MKNLISPKDYPCSHFDIYEGIRIACPAQSGEACKFVNVFGQQRLSQQFHSEREDKARREFLLKESTQEFMRALESIR